VLARGDGGTLPCRAFPVFENFSAPVLKFPLPSNADC
jgi:hypothetical protein